MKPLFKTLILFTASFVWILPADAQPWPRQEEWIMDNNKRMTGYSVSLFNVHSDYDFPYLIPSRENVTEKLVRICNFLERTVMRDLIDPSTGKPVTNYDKLPENFEMGPTDFRPYGYENGVTHTAMFEAYQVTGDERFRSFSLDRLKLLVDIRKPIERMKKKNPDLKIPEFIEWPLFPQNLDDAGSLVMAMIRWEMSGQAGFSMRGHIDRIIDYVMDHPRLEDGTYYQENPINPTIWLDHLYMGTPVLCEMYKLTGEQKYLDEALVQYKSYIEKLFIPEENLFMHFRVPTLEWHPRMKWGRANGWGIMSLVVMLDTLPEDHPDRPLILDTFTRLCKGLLGVQARNGMWHQLLDRPDSYPESSATAMFVYGLAHGINRGWLDSRAFGPATILGWNGLTTRITNDGQIEDVCVGTGVSFEPAYYYYRHTHLYTTHGYGPVLLAGSEIIELVENFRVVQDTAIYFHGPKDPGTAENGE